MPPPMTSLATHPERNSIRLQLRQNLILQGISAPQWTEPEPPMPLWAEFLERHPEIKLRFEYEVMKLMSEVMAHTITLHLLDAPGRLSRFQRKHPELAGRIPKKELAAYLNLTPETLSRLKQKLGDA